MRGYYIRNCKDIDKGVILQLLLEQTYDSLSLHCFDYILSHNLNTEKHVVIYDGIIRPIWCDDNALEMFLTIKDLQELFLDNDKILLGEI